VQARESQPHPQDKLRQLQRRRSLAAKRSRNRRFHARYDRLVRPDVWWRAWEEVRANGGSAGVDGVGIEDVERGGVQGFLDELAADLQARQYRPQPV
jgi:RNA-directed DNA polymerase